MSNGWWRRALKAVGALGRSEGARPKSRKRAPEVLPLERRDLMTIITSQSTVTVFPAIVPPTGGAAVVTVFGQIASTRETSVRDGFFQVTDEYRQVEPTGPVVLTPLGPSEGYYRYGFSFNVRLQATAKPNSSSGGRQYFFLVGASDEDNTEGKTIAAFVPTTRPPGRPPIQRAPQFRAPAPRRG